MTDRSKPRVTFQEIKVKSSQLKKKVREIIEEGNARRVIIQKDGRTLLEFPLAVGVGGVAAAVLISAPLTALGAIAALVTDVHIIIERVETDTEPGEHQEETASDEPEA